MLARLDELPGVAESRVDWTGRRFLLRLEPNAQASHVGADAQDALGEDASLLDAEATHAAIDAYRDGEAWMRAGETLRLSRYEAEVLAERFGAEAGSEIGLAAEATRKLVLLFERELNAAFESTHAAAGGAGLSGRIEEAIGRVFAASAEFLDAAQRDALAEYLERFDS